MTEIMICLDINLEGKQLVAAEKIRERVANRHTKSFSIYYRDDRRWSVLLGGERLLLERIAVDNVDGRLYGVDGIFKGGINIAVSVTPELLDMIRDTPAKYSITALHYPSTNY